MCFLTGEKEEVGVGKSGWMIFVQKEAKVGVAQFTAEDAEGRRVIKVLYFCNRRSGGKRRTGLGTRVSGFFEQKEAKVAKVGVGFFWR